MIERNRLIDLRESLGAEILRYRELLDACVTQREKMLDADGPAMQEAMTTQNELLESCREASAERLALVATLSTELGLCEPHTLGRLIASLPDGSGKLIRGETETMRSLCAEIREQAERIVRLSEHRMDLLKGDFDEILRIVRDESGKTSGATAGDQGTLVSTQA